MSNPVLGLPIEVDGRKLYAGDIVTLQDGRRVIISTRNGPVDGKVLVMPLDSDETFSVPLDEFSPAPV